MNNNITLENLSNKFRPYLLGDSSCKLNQNDWKEVDIQFNYSETKTIKGHVIATENYIFKGPRSDIITTLDTHLYRVRKAEKIREYIERNDLRGHLLVPKKCLYWDANKKVFYVVSQKIALSDEVVRPRDFIEKEWKTMKYPPGRIKDLVNGSRQRSFSAIQAKALAELSFSGYNDLNYGNFFFTQTGQVAIIDTEPTYRFLKKYRGYDFFIGKEPLSTKLGIKGIAHLKLYTDDAKALTEINKVETTYVTWCIAKLVGKIAALIFVSCAIYFIPMKPDSVILSKIVTVALPLFALSKIPSLLAEIRSVNTIWNYSCQERIDLKLINKGFEEGQF